MAIRGAWLLAFCCIALAISGVATDVRAQRAPQGTPFCHDWPDDHSRCITHACNDDGDCIEDLANFIRANFPYSDANGNGRVAVTGTDWCFHVETDLAEKYWAFKYYDNVVSKLWVFADQNTQATRIKLIFGNDADGDLSTATMPFGFASIFLALNLSDAAPYSSTYLAIPGADLRAALRAAGLSDLLRPPKPGVINFPAPDQTSCMTFPDFLRTMFTSRMTIDFWPWCSVTVNGNVDDSPCQTESQLKDATGNAQLNRQTGNTNEKDPEPLYWNFNGKEHRIAETYRFFVHIYPTDANGNVLPNTQPAPAFLSIGFGGNSGPG
jgi:hypothetical protein